MCVLTLYLKFSDPLLPETHLFFIWPGHLLEAFGHMCTACAGSYIMQLVKQCPDTGI